MSADRNPTPGFDGAVPSGTRLEAAVADLFLDDRARLDERTRVVARGLLETAVRALERDMLAHLRLLLPDAATLGNAPVYPRLADSGLLRDPALVLEMVAQARIAAIDEALVAQRPPGTAPDLLARLADSTDRAIRAGAMAYLIADHRWRQPGGDLPLALHRRLAWWIAAALRERLGDQADAALAEAAERSIAGRADTPDPPEAAVALAGAIPPQARDASLLDALQEGQTNLFAALLAHALAIDVAEARALALCAEGDGLWLALRAMALPREVIARIGWTLSEADGCRDVESLPDALDRVDAIDPVAARRALAVPALPAPFRAAVRALGRAA